MIICHLTSAHPRYDIRIFRKQCSSLSKKFNIYLVVADGVGNETNNNVHIVDVGKAASRRDRIFNTPNKILKYALDINADIYHLHDPELLSIALKLKNKGKKVIFDAHEDFPKQILTKPYLNKISARVISLLISYYEKYVCKRLNHIVTATPAIRDKFLKFSKNTTDINNYPLLGELEALNKDWSSISSDIAYVGGISKIRGIEVCVKSFEHTTSDARLNLVGTFNETATEANVQKFSGWSKIIAHGQLSRTEVKEILEKSIAGVVTFLPVPNHIDSQPNKMFEYMSAGIPVIGSNFPLWQSIIEGNNCGICVDPENPEEIATAIDKLVLNKKLAEEMGKNGIQAVNEKYNWSIEEAKLFKLYEELLGN